MRTFSSVPARASRATHCRPACMCTYGRCTWCWAHACHMCSAELFHRQKGEDLGETSDIGLGSRRRLLGCSDWTRAGVAELACSVTTRTRISISRKQSSRQRSFMRSASSSGAAHCWGMAFLTSRHRRLLFLRHSAVARGHSLAAPVESGTAKRGQVGVATCHCQCCQYLGSRCSAQEGVPARLSSARVVAPRAAVGLPLLQRQLVVGLRRSGASPVGCAAKHPQ